MKTSLNWSNGGKFEIFDCWCEGNEVRRGRRGIPVCRWSNQYNLINISPAPEPLTGPLLPAVGREKIESNKEVMSDQSKYDVTPSLYLM